MIKKTHLGAMGLDFVSKEIHYRLGTTSYIQPADILPNVRWLIDKVQDIELVIFEVDDGPNNLPTPDEINSLVNMARISDLSYTVHLPLDLKLSSNGTGQHVSLEKAKRVIERTLPLEPEAFIVHLDGNEIHSHPTPQMMEKWTSQACRALEAAARWSRAFESLAIENLEGYPPGQLDGVMARVPVSRCVDVGHLWLDGHDPLPLLEKFLPRTRVIHLHGVHDSSSSAPNRSFRDHQSLSHMPPEKLQPVIDILSIHSFHGVLTLEVFNESDFLTSKEQVILCQRI
jgi:sugar phosphate isomerase/epimerase